MAFRKTRARTRDGARAKEDARRREARVRTRHETNRRQLCRPAAPDRPGGAEGAASSGISVRILARMPWKGFREHMRKAIGRPVRKVLKTFPYTDPNIYPCSGAEHPRFPPIETLLQFLRIHSARNLRRRLAIAASELWSAPFVS